MELMQSSLWDGGRCISEGGVAYVWGLGTLAGQRPAVCWGFGICSEEFRDRG